MYFNILSTKRHNRGLHVGTYTSDHREPNSYNAE